MNNEGETFSELKWFILEDSTALRQVRTSQPKCNISEVNVVCEILVNLKFD